jgi:uncharacterized membrane protein
MFVRYGLTYLLTLVIFGAIDAVWLGLIAASMYRQTLGDILLDKFRVLPAVAFYLLNIAGLMVFAVPGARDAGRWQHALLFGALYGVFTYATYDLTNYATLKIWTLRLTLTDIAWGAFVSGVATALGVFLADAILGGPK